MEIKMTHEEKQEKKQNKKDSEKFSIDLQKLIQLTTATPAQIKELQDKLTALAADKFGGDVHKLFYAYADQQTKEMNKDELIQLLSDASVGNWLTRGAWASGIMDAVDTNKDGLISVDELNVILTVH
jgi:Ca2+-binding EF-hand superfamily protein